MHLISYCLKVCLRLNNDEKVFNKFYQSYFLAQFKIISIRTDHSILQSLQLDLAVDHVFKIYVEQYAFYRT